MDVVSDENREETTNKEYCVLGCDFELALIVVALFWLTNIVFEAACGGILVASG